MELNFEYQVRSRKERQALGISTDHILCSPMKIPEELAATAAASSSLSSSLSSSFFSAASAAAAAVISLPAEHAASAASALPPAPPGEKGVESEGEKGAKEASGSVQGGGRQTEEPAFLPFQVGGKYREREGGRE